METKNIAAQEPMIGEGVGFERIRRITGYLVGTLDRFNNGKRAVLCASTGNTSASAAAYATRAGMTCAVLIPEGKIAMGKLAQAVMAGATIVQVQGNFDDCLELARKVGARGIAEKYPVLLGGAALTRSYVENDLSSVFKGDVRYAREVQE